MIARELLDRYQIGAGGHNYDKPSYLGPSYLRAVLKPFAKSVEQRHGKGSKILDAASGTGETADILDDWGFKTFRVDVSEHALSLDTGDKIRADARQLPLKPESVQAIHLKDALVHIPGRAALFRNFHQALDRNGLLLIVTAAFACSHFNCYEFDNSLTYQYFSSLQDCAEKQRRALNNPRFRAVGPPYFAVNTDRLIQQAQRAGLLLESRSGWTNQRGEYDWHDGLMGREVLTFAKN